MATGATPEVILVSASGASLGAFNTGGTEVERALALVRSRPIHGISYADVIDLKLGNLAAGALLALLSDPAEAEHWNNAVAVSAMVGQSSVVEQLIVFLERSSDVVLVDEEYEGKAAVVMNLGFLAYRFPQTSAGRRAFAYLRDGVDPQVWRSRIKWRHEDRSQEAVANDLSTLSIWGLAIAGGARPHSVEARETLQKVQKQFAQGVQEGQFSDKAELAAEAEETRKQIAAKGLLRYFQDARQHQQE
jgi:hypothetical protein